MKGTILKCLEELVVSKGGTEVWKEILTQSNTGMAGKMVLPNLDIEDAKMMDVVKSTCQVLNLTLEQAADAFGEFWMNEYAPKYYKNFYNVPTAKEFILNMDRVHIQMTATIQNARPPRFEYTWENDKTLVVTYKSSRGLIDFAVGLCRGVGKYYKENIKVNKISTDRFRVIFP